MSFLARPVSSPYSHNRKASSALTTKRRQQTDKDNTVSQVKWQAPPAGKVKYDWGKIAVRLRTKPGEWALVFQQDRLSVANAIRSGRVKDIRPEDGFEVRTANTITTVRPRVCSLYLRYNPKG